MMPPNGMQYIIDHQCPQCGAPAALEESDRFFRCGYCRVSSYLSVPGHFRYTLAPPSHPSYPLVFFPYWRFKGMLFTCLESGAENRFLDVSHQATGSLHFPMSLGFRSQTQKLRFAAPLGESTFLKPQSGLDRFMEMLDQRFAAAVPKHALHRAYIGETVSLIYAPYGLRGRQVVDAVTNTPVPGADAREAAVLLENEEKAAWPITFLPAICPRCGWDLDAASDALVLPCLNCRTAWHEESGRFEEVETVYVPGAAQGETYFPFWRIRADVSGVELQTYADLIHLANLPKVVQPGWDRRRFFFWSPAFKVRPQTLLNLASQLCLCQPEESFEAGPPSGALFSANMPPAEAAEILKVVLASCIRPRERMIQVISQLRVSARSFQIVYLPFREGQHELINDSLKLVINKNMLRHSKNL